MSDYPERINISPVHRQKREDDFYLVDRAAFPGKGTEYIRADTDALERVRQEAKAEALRDAADYHKTEACFQADIGATDYYLMHKRAEKYILALIPDQHKEGG